MISTNSIKSVAIRSSFIHHAKHAGYKQILKYTRPVAMFGIDETKGLPSLWRQKYQWLYEFDVHRYAKKHPFDVLHILYGENYFRFSSILINKQIPLVVSFHQPPELLEREILFGDTRGRIGGLTHQLTKKRYSNITAAIVMTEAQKETMQLVMDPDKIHVIPMGTDIHTLIAKGKELKKDRFSQKQIITVGNWLRDWEFYFKVVDHCKEKHPDWNFVLVCRNLPEEYKALPLKFPNLKYMPAISDDELIGLYTQSKVQFLPVIETAGNNSVMESLSLGCPLVITDVGTNYNYKGHHFIRLHTKKTINSAVQELQYFLDMEETSFSILSEEMTKWAFNYDWSIIGNRTLQVYQEAIKKRK